MMRLFFGLSTIVFSLVFGAVACGDDDETQPTGDDNTNTTVEPFGAVSCEDFTGTCSQFLSTETDALLTAVNSLANDTTIVLGAGTFSLNVGIAMEGFSGITLIGQGMDLT
ncbi:MAG: hypothetical protein AAF658_13205, partial [Myxococcota bacterium]